jgi:small subunit ribosomal protein S1
VSKNKKASHLKSSGNATMDDLLAKYGGLTRSLSMGDRVSGTVVRIEPGRVVFDIGGKSEGIVAEKAYKEAEEYVKTLKVGDEVEASVIVPETNDGFTILSLRRALEDSSWSRIDDAYEKGEEVSTIVRAFANAGLSVDVLGVQGFIPTSQLGKEAAKNAQNLVGKTLHAIIIDVDREKKRMVLSEKEVSEKEELALKKKALGEVEKGETYEGTVTSVYDFGCFVAIDIPVQDGKDEITVPVEGLVHISQLSWDKVEKPSDVISVGDTVSVSVLEKIVPTAGQRVGKLSLSIKQAQKDPWEGIDNKYAVEARLSGTVTRATDYGVFVQLEPGVEGLIHITKLPPGKKLQVGDEVNVYIEEIETQSRKISLGLVLTEKPLGYR